MHCHREQQLPCGVIRPCRRRAYDHRFLSGFAANSVADADSVPALRGVTSPSRRRPR